LIGEIDCAKAQAIFDFLPADRKLFTLSPRYVQGDAARDASLEPLFVRYAEQDAFWLHGVHLGRAEPLRGYDLQSPYGYGGPVSNSDDAGFWSRAWSHYGRWCVERGVVAEFIRLHPLAAAWQRYGGLMVPDRPTVAIALEAADLRAQYAVRCRTAVRKAEAHGLAVGEAPPRQIVEQFAQLYRQGMAALGATDFYRFDDRYFAAFSGMDNVHLLVCKQGERWLAAGLFLQDGRTLEYHLSVTTQEGRKLAATNLLLDHAAAFGRERGLKTLFLGGGTDGRPDNPLLFFKSGFSGWRMPFRIGYAIHQPDVYDALKRDYQAQGLATGRVLFYR